MSTRKSKLSTTSKEKIWRPSIQDDIHPSKVAFVSLNAILNDIPAKQREITLPNLYTRPMAIRSLGKLQDEYGYKIAIITPDAEALQQISCLVPLLTNEGIESITITAESTAELPRAVTAQIARLTPESVVVSRGDEMKPLASALELTHHDLRVIRDPLPDSIAPDVSQSVIDDSQLDWQALSDRLRPPHRVATVHRVTKETDVVITINLDGRGAHKIATGIGFFDHMLVQVAYHGLIDLEIAAKGDLHIDEHHTVEDVGITLGRAVADALGDKRGIERFGYVAPLDDALARVTVDFSGRSFLVWRAQFQREKIGDLPTEMIQHFFRSFADEAKCNIHVEMYGENDHHRAECIFKAFGRAVHNAFLRSRPMTIPSTKGTLG